MVLSSNDREVITVGLNFTDRNIVITSINEGTKLKIFQLRGITSIRLRIDQKRIVIGSTLGDMKIFCLETGIILHEFEKSYSALHELILTKDKRFLISGSPSDKARFKMWDAFTYELVWKRLLARTCTKHKNILSF